MAVNNQNVVAAGPGAGGVAWSAPLGSTLPTDVSTALDAAFVGLGYLSDDGLTESPSRTAKDLKAYGGDIVKVATTERSKTYKFTMIEFLNADVQAEVYGAANVTTTAATISAGNLADITETLEDLPHKTYVFVNIDGDAVIRDVVPDGQIVEVGDLAYKDGEAVGYPVTVRAFYNSAISGYTKKYTDDGRTV